MAFLANVFMLKVMVAEGYVVSRVLQPPVALAGVLA